MIKKIILTIILGLIIFSCGKKGDPTYKALIEKKNLELSFKINLNEIL